jgi:enoyl-[acyl-carrier protein] reductase II
MPVCNDGLIKTRITEAFAIRHPVLSAGMGHLAVPELVAAVSNAGGLGLLATSTAHPDAVRDAIRSIRRLTDAPFGANVLLRSDSAPAIVEVLVAERVPVVNVALGNDAAVVGAVHDYGGLVIGSITSVRHALAAERIGVDAVIATGHEAAGHGGALSTLVLVALVTDAIGLPVVAAGGFCDGRGLAAAVLLGADAVSMGTRFAISVESPLHAGVRLRLQSSGGDDTIVTDRIDGLPSRVLGTPLARTIASSVAVGDASTGPGRDTFAALRLGDLDRGVVAIGQVVGAIDDNPTCAQIVEHVVAEAEELLAVRARQLSRPT